MEVWRAVAGIRAIATRHLSFQVETAGSAAVVATGSRIARSVSCEETRVNCKREQGRKYAKTLLCIPVPASPGTLCLFELQLHLVSCYTVSRNKRFLKMRSFS